MNENQKLIKSKQAINILFNDLLSYSLIETDVLIVTFGNDKINCIDDKWFNLRLEVDYLKTKIDNIVAYGNTPLYKAIMGIYNFFENDGFNSANNVIICLSDGVDTENEDLFKNLSKKVELLKIPIISIGFDNNNYRNLIQLSELSGAGEVGVGYFVGIDPIDLIGIFSKIVFTITKSYRISWKPSFLEYKKRIKVVLEVNYLTQHGKNKKSEIELEYEIEKE